MTNPISAPPRTLTPQARRAAWGHPIVRFWWLVTAILAIAVIYFAFTETMQWRQSVWLVQNGQVVQASVKESSGSIKGRQIPSGSEVELEYDYAGQHHKVTGTLDEHKDTIVNGQTIPVRINPASPEIWTNRQEAPSFAGELSATFLLIPPVLISLGITLIQKRRALALWKSGQARQAVVVDRRQSPLAPLSQAATCALADGKDKRVFTVYVPQSAGRINRGDTIWVMVDPKDARRAMPAAVFQ